MKWHQLWKARFGEELKAADVVVWDEELNDEVSHLNQSEILSAVRAIAEDKRIGKIKYKPTLNHLISTIVRLRYQDRHGGDDKAQQTKSASRLNELKHTIRVHLQNGRKVDAWIAMCHHPHGDEIMAAERWAEDELGFTRPTHEEMGTEPLPVILRRTMADDCRIQRVTDEIKTRGWA